ALGHDPAMSSLGDVFGSNFCIVPSRLCMRKSFLKPDYSVHFFRFSLSFLLNSPFCVFYKGSSLIIICENASFGIMFYLSIFRLCHPVPLYFHFSGYWCSVDCKPYSVYS
uniref:Uncharacterized protein n=1 Tax=Chelonoidis abingdonii TaxID=106734 RepID=A0A8C0GXS5_CHEAB